MFSSTIKLTDLNDFLLPSQECIKPLLQTKNANSADVVGTTLASNQPLSSDTTLPRPNLIKLTKRQKRRKSDVSRFLSTPSASDQDIPFALTTAANKDSQATAPVDLSEFLALNDESVQKREHAKLSAVNLSKSTNDQNREAGEQSTSFKGISEDVPNQVFRKDLTSTYEFEETNAFEAVAVSPAAIKDSAEQNATINTSQSHFHQENDNPKSKLQDDKLVAQVSLFDCLACSGCVTTAETVLLQQQSVQEFLRKLNSKALSVVSVSPQSRTALSNFFHLTADAVMRKLSGFFKSIGVRYVLDTTISEAICILETQREFSQRYRSEFSRKYAKVVPFEGQKVHAPLEELSAASIEVNALNEFSLPAETGGSFHASSSIPYSSKWPLLSSHCPGWICYAEKVLDETVLPLISRVRSSQQIQGLLVKSLLRKSYNASLFLQQYRALLCPSLPIFSTSFNFANDRANFSSIRYSSIYEVLLKYAATRRSTIGTLFSDVLPEGAKISSPSHRLEYSYSNNLSKSEEKCMEKSLYRILQPSDVFHTCIMPCFDKKIESARPEFVHSDSTDYFTCSDTTPDVDTVLATSELLELFNYFKIDFVNFSECDVDSVLTPVSLSLLGYNESVVPKSKSAQVVNDTSVIIESQCPSLTEGKNSSACCQELKKNPVRISEYHGGSGGFVDAIFRNVAKEFYGIHFDGPLPFKVGKNKDYKEVSLIIEGEVVLKCAVAYGFRNIQNVMRRIQNRDKAIAKGTSGQLITSGFRDNNLNSSSTSETVSDLHFIELMACPGGCLNGAGQTLDAAQKLLKKENTENEELHSKLENTEKFNSKSVVAKVVQSGEKEGIDKAANGFNVNATGTVFQKKNETVVDSSQIETPWVREGLSKLEEQKAKLDALERLFHSDSQVPYIPPTLIPYLEAVYTFLKLRDGCPDVILPEFAREPIKGVLTQYNSIKKIQASGNDSGYVSASVLKW